MKIMQTLALLAVVSLSCVASAEEWSQFRGPGGLGISKDTKIPTTWSSSKNLLWRTSLPGPGSSSPIISGDKVFVTCFAGYGIDRGNPGSLENLSRHLICLNRKNGKILWSKQVQAEMPEDQYSRMLGEHGYASSTPAADGERVFVFYGKSGVLAFDYQGKKLWQTNVGKESSPTRWGSASSPVLYKDLVIVNASDESLSIRALDKKTGKEVWKAEAETLEQSFGTPILVDQKNGGKELVIPVPGEIWGFNPDNGKLKWYAVNGLTGNVSPSPVASEGVVYALGGRGGGGVAVRTGGKNDVTDTHTVWDIRQTSYVPSPLIHQGHLYWVKDDGVVNCVSAKTGKSAFSKRLSIQGGGGFMSKPFYASVVLVGDKIIAVSRKNGAFVFAAKPKYQAISQNKFADDDSDFNASPAISDGQLFLRSNKYLYCVQASGK